MPKREIDLKCIATLLSDMLNPDLYYWLTGSELQIQ